MDKITQFVKRHFSSWQSGLETILEQEPSLNLEKLSLSFETSTDISHLESTLDFLPLDEADRIIHIFSRLSPYFDGGLLLQLHPTESSSSSESWTPAAVFRKGEYYPLTPEHWKHQIELPYLGFTQLRKTSAHFILKNLQLTEINDQSETSAFAFKAHSNFLILVFSELPEPWLRTHIENVFRILIRKIHSLDAELLGDL